MFCSHCLVSVNSINETSCCVFVDWSLNCLWSVSDGFNAGLSLTESDWVWLSCRLSDTWRGSPPTQLVTVNWIRPSSSHQIIIIKKKNCSENNLLLYDQLLTDWKHFTFQLCDSLFCLILDWSLRADRKHPSDDRLCDVTSSLRQDELLRQHVSTSCSFVLSESFSHSFSDKDKSKHSQDLLEIKIKTNPVTESVLL